jgi:hypothetical protein
VVNGPPLGSNGVGALPGWAELEPALPQIVATMRRYLSQIGCVLRPGSVGGAGLALRCFAAFLAETAPGVTSTAQVTRRHIEDYKPWLAAQYRKAAEVIDAQVFAGQPAGPGAGTGSWR